MKDRYTSDGKEKSSSLTSGGPRKNTDNMKAVFSAIKEEREYQDIRWGTLEENPHEIAAYVLFIEQYVSVARTLLTKGNNDSQVLDAVRKIAALGVACMEEHGVVRR